MIQMYVIFFFFVVDICRITVMSSRMTINLSVTAAKTYVNKENEQH